MSIEEQAREIVKNVGGPNNIKSLTRCMTRLRFVLKDDSKVNEDALKKLDDVMDIRKAGGQFQVIIGAKIDKYYNAVVKDNPGLNAESVESETSEKKGVFSRVVETLSSILIPTLPPIIGGGMIKGFLFMFVQFNWMSANSSAYILFNVIADCMFYFFPFLLAVSTARSFKTNVYMALALAGAMMYPSILQSAAKGGSLKLFGGLVIPYIDYSSSVIPIILTVWLMSYVYRFFKKYIPDIISAIFTPLLTLVVVIPIELVAIAPLGFYIGNYIAIGMQYLINLSPILAGFIIGGTRPLLVLTGTHHAVRAITQQQVATYGRTTIGAMNFVSTFAQSAAALGVYFFTKNKRMKSLSFSSTISGFLGVTEPALYGVVTKYKIAMLGAVIGGGVGGAIASYFNAAVYGIVLPSILTISATIGKGFIGMALGVPTSIVVTLLVIFLGRKSIIRQDEEDLAKENNQNQDITVNHDNLVSAIKNANIMSPANGKIQSLSSLNDKTFASGMLGKGIAVKSTDGKVFSPVDGVITSVFPTKHAIGLKAENGVEILLHIGIDTVNLNGKFLHPEVKEGDKVVKGQQIMTFDFKKIIEAGYDDVVIMLITNTDQLLNINNVKDSGETTKSQVLMTV
ncbi:beta-glucoside-specific PTS transporter subunit IIABC [Lactobacillus sp. ESL0731]|uniref:beta-glucoside-specific PTS transporter subunit IIABC n=1 Tax=unclassified Lactobacillus TaxID=2620435 RepID=UPI0023F988C4|nr:MULTISPECIES: beta-glucoside-specific PTS transporter subunit IIABC [unclassified Lactobacillus]WEV51625.1 beta-glucoside-specific PTS transporter subunit IIABC [Lactobacillus sp. ESL0700]WEV62754.1 beta-glucoside-specific PTS transporter subunit IIABC [Lactobacillus sp. ESL0731]